MSPTLLPDLRCVIFDMDGTLTRTNPLIFASFNHVAARRLGTTLTPERITGLFGPPEEGGLARLLGRDDVREEMEELCRYYAEHHDRLASLHEGILPLLEGLKARGVIRTLFTGKGRRTTDITMRAFGLEPLLDLVVTGSDVVRHKPDPEGILTTLRTFGVARENALMVGDSMADGTSARRAGVRFAAVTWDTTQEPLLRQADPDHLFRSVPELAAFLLQGAV